VHERWHVAVGVCDHILRRPSTVRPIHVVQSYGFLAWSGRVRWLSGPASRSQHLPGLLQHYGNSKSALRPFTQPGCSTTRRGVALAVSGRGAGGANGPGSSGQHGSPAGTGRGTDDTPAGRAQRAQPRRARPWAAGAEGGRRPRVAAPRAATSGRCAWPRFPLVSTYRLGGLVLHCI